MGDKKQLVRDYIMCLIGEGTFEGAKSPLSVIAKATAAFTKDVGSVVGEMAAQFAHMNGGKLQVAAVEHVRDFVGSVFDRGLKAAWEDLQELHQRGMDVKAKRKA